MLVGYDVCYEFVVCMFVLVIGVVDVWIFVVGVGGMG